MRPGRRWVVVAALAAAGAALSGAGAASGAATLIQVDAAHPGGDIAPTMFGIFFEDINFGADGGLYPELVKNRSFEFDQPLAGWRAVMPLDAQRVGLAANLGELKVRTDGALNAANPHYLTVHAFQAGFGLTNSGLRGIGVEQGADYRFSAWVRSAGPTSLRATITDAAGHAIGTGTLSGFDGTWRHYETIIRATATEPKGQLAVVLGQPGSLDLDMVSLYPVDTFRERPNGLRKDLAQLLADLHPGFIRFPGGCIVEGRRLVNRYQWKATVGPIEARRTIVNRWNDEFDHRPTPDYYQSFGLGFFEYFQLAEDIGASPLPILNCGMACQFNSAELAPLDDTQEFIQDALDLIEFANGAVTTPWGRLRADMGHPAPFRLQMIGVGNEQWGQPYVDRYERFAAAIKASHPEIRLVAAAGPSPAGEQFEFLWSHWRRLGADLVDEHYYSSPQWFLDNAGRYDHYDRNGPKVFAGEYAAQTTGVARPDNRNNWQAAIAEAAFMTGLERNADVVRMASYAPLLAHVDAWQWTPDAIWFDNLRSYGTPNYYVQKVFANNVGTRILPVGPREGEGGLYTSASLDERAHELIVKVVNATPSARDALVELHGATPVGAVAVTTLASADLAAENSLARPTALAPVQSTLPSRADGVPVRLGAYSLVVLRIPLR